MPDVGPRNHPTLMRAALTNAILGIAMLSTASAHEVRPAYLEIRETDSGTYDAMLKVPARGGSSRLGVDVRLPEDARALGQPQGRFVDGAFMERWRFRRDGGIDGQTIELEGLSSTGTDALVRFTSLDGRTQTFRATPYRPSVTIPEKPTVWQVVHIYTALGIEHILQGVDHLLFVLGLVMIVGSRWMLFKTITAFTVAHSLTLAAATLGYASAPLPPLNAAIALSILFLGPEMLRSWRGDTSLTIRYPWVVAFAFGLLHGFGFASGLKATGLPQADIAWALLLFNVGVEIGQVFFVFLILGMAWSYRRLEIHWPRMVQALPAYTVGTLGAFWTIQRTAMMLGIIR